jgi:hypothetical protein
VRKYSQFDQYLMGLRRSDEVDPMWYVAEGGNLYGCADWPQARGVAHDVSGTRVDFTMEDVIRALGSRDPSVSPCHYKVAFIFVHAPGNPPSAFDLDKVERYRTALETWYASATDGRGSLDTRLDGCGIGTPQCPGDVSVQCTTPPDDITEEEGDDQDSVIDEPEPAADDLDAAAGDADAAGADEDAAGADGNTDVGSDDGSGGCGCRVA